MVLKYLAVISVCLIAACASADGITVPHRKLIEAKNDLYSRGGCESDERYLNTLDKKYKDRWNEIINRIMPKFNNKKYNELILVGSCNTKWDEKESEKNFEKQLIKWERKLGV